MTRTFLLPTVLEGELTMLDIIGSYSFLVVAIGTVILAAAAGMVGTFSVLKGQALIGDAVSHSAFPGIVIAFMLFKTKDPMLLSAGAIISGAVSFAIIQAVHHRSKVSLDTVLAIVLSSFFGMGMALMTYVDGKVYEGTNRAGISDYIFGQAAYTMKSDVYMIIAVSALAIFLLILFYKELKIFVFDSEYAATMGFRPRAIYAILLIMTMVLIGVGMKIVGSILIASMLIAPGVTGLLWSKKLSVVLIIAAAVGAVSAFFGTLISIMHKGFSTGPSIIVVMSSICLVSLLISPEGLISTALNRAKNKKGEERS